MTFTTVRLCYPARGHRQANSAGYRAVIVRMRFHQPTIDYVTRRTAEGKTKREIIRCLKRYLAREIYRTLVRPAGGAPTEEEELARTTTSTSKSTTTT